MLLDASTTFPPIGPISPGRRADALNALGAVYAPCRSRVGLPALATKLRGRHPDEAAEYLTECGLGFVADGVGDGPQL